MAIFCIMYYLTYINKQYSKWSIWLFYVMGVSVFVKFLVPKFIKDTMKLKEEQDLTI